MLRQISNLIHTGRVRTTAPTPRTGKPSILKNRPEIEIYDYLEMAIGLTGGPRDDFFFVQIGAFDGQEGDHLNQLIQRFGWRGLLIEPQPQAFEQLKLTYADQPQLEFFNVAIGPEPGTLTLYTRKNGAVPIASVSKRLLVKPGHSGSEVVSIDVPCLTLEQLLEKADAGPRIDLLQIDTEGFDYEIIRSIPFERIRPAIIRYEHALLSSGDCNACIELLAAQGYQILLEDRDTIAVLRSESSLQAA